MQFIQSANIRKTMNIIDIILLISLIPFLIQGLLKGIIRQIFSILAIFLGVWASYKFGSLVAQWLANWFNVSPKVMTIIAFIIVFILIFIGIYFLGRLLEKIVKVASLGWVDKLFGLLFSILKYVLVIGVIIIAFDALNNVIGIVKPEVIDDSVLYGPIKKLAIDIFPYLKKLITLS